MTREVPEGWSRASDLEEERDEMGVEVYRSDRNPALLVTVEDNCSSFSIDAEVATADNEWWLISMNESERWTALRKAEKLMDALNRMDEAFVEMYGLGEEDDA